MANDDPFQTIDIGTSSEQHAASPTPLPSSESKSSSRISRLKASRKFSRRSFNAGAEAGAGMASHDGATVGLSSSLDPLTSDLAPTSERYERLTELGRGGWGVVDRVVDWHLEREVAIKKIGGDGKVDPDVRQRFFYEAKITSQLQHPGVVPVHELGTGENGEAYYVMKLLEGDTLRQLIRTQHAPAKKEGHRWTANSLETAIAPLLDRFIHVCNAVAYAHQQGVIHRDLKPSNVMVGDFGETIVVDWGLAKTIESASSFREPVIRSERDIEQNADSVAEQLESLQNAGSSNHHTSESDSAHHTTQGSIVGTPAYMSPEQAFGQLDQLGPASDIYSLGVILYEIVLGHHPYRGLDLLPMIEKVRSGKCPSLKSVQPLVRGSLAAICEKAMAFDPAARYQSASDLADDIQHYIARDAVSAYQESLIDRLGRCCRRHQSLAISVAVSTLILLVASVLFGTIIHQAHQAEKASRIESQRSHMSAVKSLTEARDAADAWLVDLSGSLEFYPGLETVRAELLNNAIVQYEKLLVDQLAITKDQQAEERLNFGEHGHALTATLETAKCHLRLGDLYRLSGRGGDAGHYYNCAESILAELEGIEHRDHETDQFKDTIRLLRINVAIGRRLVAASSIDSSADAHRLVSDMDFHLHRQWLLEQLPMDHSESKFSDHKSQDHQAQAASALVRYPLAINRSSKSGEHDERVDESLQHAVQWARWLVAVRGEPRDIGLSETVQRELATRHENSEQHELAVTSWDRLILDIMDWHDEAAPRPDRLQSLAHARMRYAQCLAKLGRNDDAANAYRDAITELNQAWQLLDTDAFHQTSLATAQNKLGGLLKTDSAE